MHAFLLAACCLLTGHVHSAAGIPLAGVRIALHGATAASTRSDANGDFTIVAPPGDYRLDASAAGYGSVSIDLKLEADSTVDASLEALDAPTLRTIAAVTIDGRLTPIRGTIPAITITRADMDRAGDARVIDALATLPGATFAHPDGGGASAISVVALRGPDPSESLVALDGQLLNDGNTGDLDLSQFPIAAFSSVNVTEGLGPEDTNGSNTFGGAINLVSLHPTVVPHAAFSESAGSFGQSELWLNATGTHGKLGYALALDDQHQAGYSNGYVNLHSTIDPSCQPCGTALGSSVASRAALENVVWNFSQRANITARIFTLGDNRDQSGSIDGIDGTGDATSGQFIGPGNETLAQVIRAYQIRGQTPFGAGDLTTDLYASNNVVAIAGIPSNPAYDITHADRRYNGGLTWQRTFDTAQFALGGYTDYESLAIPGLPTLGQNINVLFARGGFQPIKELHLDAGVYESRYSSFGSNLDARLGAVYNVSSSSAVRFSLGTGFRAPLLIERYAFPLADLAQDRYGVFVGQGSTNERPEHATEYELGFSHQFGSSALDVSLYQTNLRNPVEVYYPYARALAGACLTPAQGGTNTAAHPVPGCVSFQSNVGNAVYQGLEMRFVQRFVPQHVFLTAMYGLNVAYPKNLTPNFSNPTSGANLVDNVQFPNIPQQQGSLELDYDPGKWHASASAIFRGNNNELNQQPLTWIDATIGFKLNALTDIAFVGTNLFGDGAGRYTIFGGGMPYIGIGGMPLPTDRLGVEPFDLRFVMTVHV
ncbi:MAG TPA: TonB-dependent receptor [Candidatus Baltobacteraceae bacterium]|nr:TonB-dependent receptor [Candidatus Baltobacteraceae bacterium]